MEREHSGEAGAAPRRPAVGREQTSAQRSVRHPDDSRRWYGWRSPQRERASGEERWYSLSGEEVTSRLGVDPTVGLSGQQAAELLSEHGPNALPAERPVPGWRRFLAQYRTYMQLILVGGGGRLAGRSRSGARRCCWC